MKISVLRDDVTYGPYTIAQAKEYLGTGSLELDDMASAEGTTNWVPLRTFLAPELAPASHAVPDSPVGTMLSLPEVKLTSPLRAGETVLWTGSPSQIINIPSWIAHALGAFVLLALGTWCLTIPWCVTNLGWALTAPFIAIVLVFFSAYYSYEITRRTKYLITDQRVRMQSGLGAVTVDEVELYRVRDILAQQPFILQAYGLGTLVIFSGDMLTPVLRMDAIPGVFELREILGQKTNALRQKYSVREVEMMGR